MSWPFRCFRSNSPCFLCSSSCGRCERSGRRRDGRDSDRRCDAALHDVDALACSQSDQSVQLHDSSVCAVQRAQATEAATATATCGCVSAIDGSRMCADPSTTRPSFLQAWAWLILANRCLAWCWIDSICDWTADCSYNLYNCVENTKTAPNTQRFEKKSAPEFFCFLATICPQKTVVNVQRDSITDSLTWQCIRLLRRNTQRASETNKRTSSLPAVCQSGPAVRRGTLVSAV